MEALLSLSKVVSEAFFVSGSFRKKEISEKA